MLLPLEELELDLPELVPELALELELELELVLVPVLALELELELPEELPFFQPPESVFSYPCAFKAADTEPCSFTNSLNDFAMGRKVTPL